MKKVKWKMLESTMIFSSKTPSSPLLTLSNGCLLVSLTPNLLSLTANTSFWEPIMIVSKKMLR